MSSCASAPPVNGPILSGLTDDFTAIADRAVHGRRRRRRRTRIGAPRASTRSAWSGPRCSRAPRRQSIFALNLAQSFDGLPGGSRAVRRAGAEPHLCRRRRQHRLPDARQAPDPRRGRRLDAAAGLGFDLRLAGLHPLRGAAVLLNPADGYIVTANNAIVSEDYPYLLTRDWDYGWRAARVRRPPRSARSAMGKLTADDMRDIQADNEFCDGQASWPRRIRRRLDRPPGTGCRARPAALVGRAERPPNPMPRPTRTCCGTSSSQDLFVRGREDPAPVIGQGRLFLVVEQLLETPDSAWWTNAELGVDGQHEMLEHAAYAALRPTRRAAGRQPVAVELGLAARAVADQRHVRPVGHRADRDALQPRAVSGRRRLIGRERDGMGHRRAASRRSPFRRCA